MVSSSSASPFTQPLLSVDWELMPLGGIGRVWRGRSWAGWLDGMREKERHE